VLGVDASAAALAVAGHNARRLGIANVRFAASDWCAGLDEHDGPFDLIVANPPYVAENDPHLREGDVRFEPAPALVAGPDGLAALRAIVVSAPRHLRAHGWLLVEHGYDQAERVRDLLARAGLEALVSLRDLAGIPRVAGGRAPHARSGLKSSAGHPS